MQRDVERGNTFSTGTTKKSGSRVAEVAPWVYYVLIIENNSGLLKKRRLTENGLVIRVVTSRGHNA